MNSGMEHSNHSTDHQHHSGAHMDPHSGSTGRGGAQHRGGHSSGGGTGKVHDKHAGHSPDMFRRLFWVSLVLTLPVVYWSPHVQMVLGYTAPDFAGSARVAGIMGALVFLYGGRVFLRGAVSELRSRLPGMMTLIAMAISVAFIFSAAAEIGLVLAEPIWWELATLVTIMLLGHWVEMRSVSQAQGALNALASLIPDMATRIVDGGEERVAADSIRAGDTILVRPGESIAADGVVSKGSSSVNESMITGESRPARKAAGDAVTAGTINGEGSLYVTVSGVGDETRLSGIMRLVAEAQHSKSRAQQLADRAARFLTGVAMISGVITLAAWLVAGADFDFAVVRMVTVLVIACPHALGLAVPLVVAISTTIGAQHGLLVRDRRGLEEARNVDVVVFDKTGTLTLGEFRVVEMATAEGTTREEALSIAAAMERESEHPIARGIVASAREQDIELESVSEFAALPGKGIRAVVHGQLFHIGGPSLIKSESIAVSGELGSLAQRASERGQAAIYLVRAGDAIAVFVVADAIREESREAVAALKETGIEVAMLTGDATAVARSVAAELGIGTVFSEVLPHEKADKVRELQRSGRRVAMVGDGVNDAPALATADIGIAIGAGTDVAVEAGHIVLVRSDPRDIPRIITLSRATYRKMVQNLWWGAGYNIGAIPLAAGVLQGWGILLTPAIGAVLMSASTVIVALNAQLLRREAL